MEDLSLFFKTYQPYLSGFLVMLGLSLGWALIVRFKPKWLGFEGKANKLAYLVCIIPLFVAFITTSQSSGTSFDSPQAFDMYDNLLLVKGEHKYETNDDNGLKTRAARDIIIIIDKQGNELMRFSAGNSKIHNNKIFMDGIGNYSIADLKTGKVIDVLTEGDIKERASKFISEKIFSFEYSGGSTFNMRTVRDKTFLYDALLDAEDSGEGYTLFQRKNRNPPEYSGKTSLFQPVKIGEAQNGSTILLSYDDLEKKAFIVSAVEPNGNVIWSKHDNEISPSLAGTRFSHPDCKANTLVDEQNVYFITQRYLVCLSLETGELKWLVEL